MFFSSLYNYAINNKIVFVFISVRPKDMTNVVNLFKRDLVQDLFIQQPE